MSNESIQEAVRQLQICDACRYCEGYCAVFPALHRKRAFADGDITQLANLCHNCRGCYYACQFTDPHEFDLNIPGALARVRQESWQDLAAPSGFAKLFHRHGTAVAAAVVIGFAMMIWAAKAIGAAGGGEGFYAVLSHNAMVAIFLPAFLLPVILIAVSLVKYWRHVGGTAVRMDDIAWAIAQASNMRNLSGGHGEGCNFEDEDRFTHVRRALHQWTMYGFLLCFASTSVATVMHYAFDMPAPYALFSLPKLLGVVGGVMLSAGTLGLALFKFKGERHLGDARVWGGEMAFVVLLFVVSTSGLVLYGLGGSPWLAELLAFHLGAVLAFFLLTPFSKMAHGFYRMAALVREAQLQRAGT